MRINSMGRITMGVIVVAFFLGATFSQAQGQKMEENDYWGNGKVRVSKKYNNATGNLQEVTYYREDGSKEQQIVYNMYGKKTGEAHFGSDGKLMQSAGGWAAMRWKYEDGQMIGEGYYGADGKLKEWKRYNSSGDLVAKKYVGGGINPSEEYNSAPTFAGEKISYYGSDGQPEGTTEYEEEPLAWFPEVWYLNDRYDDF